MNKTELKRVINILSVIPKGSFIRLRPMGDKTLITGYDDCKVVNVVLDYPSDNNWTIYADRLDMLKAVHKGMNKDSIANVEEDFGSVDKSFDRDADAVMKEATAEYVSEFQLDFKILEQAYKAMKDKASVIRFQKSKDGKVVITNMEGDISVIAPYYSK
jgi:hypothetical protein